MQTETRFKIDSLGRINVWDISVELNDNGTASIQSNSGLLNGALTLTSETIWEGKNIGKKNETSAYDQAVKEAIAKVKKKEQQGYVADVNNVKEAGTLGSGHKAPMKAHKYHPTDAKKGQSLDKLKLRGKQVGVQRKKDGNRCRPTITANGVELVTSSGLAFPYSFPLITGPLMEHYRQHTDGITPLVLDGELFTSVCSFNKLNGILRRGHFTNDELHILDSVKLHLYDFESSLNYRQRHALLSQFESPNVHIEETYFIEAEETAIENLLNQFLAEGEEGAMIRQLDLPYQNKRTNQLLKRKDFDDDEFEVVGVLEHVQGGRVGKWVLKAPAGSVDEFGNRVETFKAGTSMPNDESAEAWANRESFIGRLGTVRFFGYSELGRPRFPKLKGFKAEL